VRLLLMGPPGSGKGTQGERLARRLGAEHIAAGDLLRAEVERGTPIGQEVAGYLARGDLAPDSTLIDILLPRVESANRAGGFVLDGFPRTVQQATVARRLAEKGGFLLDAAIYLDVPRAELVARIQRRAQEEGRADDTPEVIHNRLDIFDEATRPLVDIYRARGLLHVVDANRPEDEVTADILSRLGR
jgi:adenylate kinase